MNIKKAVSYLFVAVSFFGCMSVAHAYDQITLGRTILLEIGDHGAKIPLVVCRNTDAIKVKAERNLHLERIKVTFRNGETRNVSFHRDLKKNQETSWRKFSYKRCVKKLEVYGNSDGTRAGVKVYGRQKD
ncbi:DUF2541 domain-containing protein [Photobacterium sp. NCIMB 13483]|uniref:DUF2541 domain-containing protein n=1 Tax=Photobacterium piscicola TaxID=1378299 RepID=A0A1T5HWY4_9GAMM|nr:MULTISPECIES: DUF2541 family protein [Photobacterium]MEC6824013.1 DUF2541 family protein [Photobacterium piscicola]PST94393.1 DUF2541 domain-containing protein [Photobacterium sp. NCIMB 13483]SKC31273.1 hypothetical protein CZ809_00751 [Photobacterium piscicola]